MRRTLAVAAVAAALAATPAAAGPVFIGGYAATGSATIAFGTDGAGGYYTNSGCLYTGTTLEGAVNATASHSGTTTTTTIRCTLQFWGGASYATPSSTDTEVTPGSAHTHSLATVPAGARVATICIYVDTSWSGPAGTHTERIAACQGRYITVDAGLVAVSVPLDPA